jgi:hypothetical protein
MITVRDKDAKSLRVRCERSRAPSVGIAGRNALPRIDWQSGGDAGPRCLASGSGDEPKGHTLILITAVEPRAPRLHRVRCCGGARRGR